MNKVAGIYLFILTLLLPLSASAKQELRIGVGNFPPFFIEEGERGLFLDITNEVFKLMPEYDVTYVFMSNSRLMREISSGKRVDVACNIFSESKVDAHLSHPIYRYTDVAVSKKNNKFKIESVSDLQDKSIAAYQGAIDLLGNEFKSMALSNAQYTEHPHPSETTLLMAMGQKDIRVGDVYIFLYDIGNGMYKRRNINANAFTIHRLWPDVFTHMAFKDESIRDKANKAIKTIKSNGTLDRLYKEYEEYLRL